MLCVFIAVEGQNDLGKSYQIKLPNCSNLLSSSLCLVETTFSSIPRFGLKIACNTDLAMRHVIIGQVKGNQLCERRNHADGVLSGDMILTAVVARRTALSVGNDWHAVADHRSALLRRALLAAADAEANLAWIGLVRRQLMALGVERRVDQAACKQKNWFPIAIIDNRRQRYLCCAGGGTSCANSVDSRCASAVSPSCRPRVSGSRCSRTGSGSKRCQSESARIPWRAANTSASRTSACRRCSSSTSTSRTWTWPTRTDRWSRCARTLKPKRSDKFGDSLSRRVRYVLFSLLISSV